ncbi:hypothetical protein EXIGLDRAFT_634752, partial [Exidia glandulosa HHB12029]
MRGTALLLFISTTLAASVKLHWVDGKTPATTPAGTAFGLPWAQGAFAKNGTVSATDANGKTVPVQTWPLAFLKWSGHALAADSALSESLTVEPGDATEHDTPVTVSQDASSVTVSTGSFKATFNKAGDTPVASLTLGSATKAQNGQLVAHIQAGPDPEIGEQSPPVTVLKGVVDSTTVEQEGPVTGKYQGGDHAPFLPFTARFYIAAGATSVRVVHFFVFDGDQNADFIKGLGLTFSTPLSDALYDRHVRFSSSDGGILGEAVLGLYGLRRDATNRVLDAQFAGTPLPDPSTWPSTISS